jgi:hypothetical protein
MTINEQDSSLAHYKALHDSTRNIWGYRGIRHYVYSCVSAISAASDGLSTTYEVSLDLDYLKRYCRQTLEVNEDMADQNQDGLTG